jgi:hypothetical protein
VHHISKVFWSIVSVSLLLIWCYTAIEVWESYHKLYALATIPIIIASMACVFLLEGYETAYTELRDKDPEQVMPDIQKLLREMQAQDGFFVGEREFLVVLFIVIISLATNLGLVYFPFVDPVEGYRVPELFGLIFTSLIVCWFSSVVAKTLAADNPQAFLLHFKFFWTLIRKIANQGEVSGFLAPSRFIISEFLKVGHFKSRQVLAPSRPAYYDNSFKRYGYAFDMINQEVEIGPFGVCQIHQTCLVWILSGRRKEFAGSVLLDSLVHTAEFETVRVFGGPPLETEPNKIFAALDMLSQAGSYTLGPEVTKEVSLRDKAVKATNGATWTIESPVQLPEDLHLIVGDRADLATRNGLLIFYKMRVAAGSGAFKFQKDATDFWEQTFPYPCRKYQLTLRIDPQLGRKFASPSVKILIEGQGHVLETIRAGNSAHLEHESRTLRFEFNFPTTGSTHVMNWAIW